MTSKFVLLKVCRSYDTMNAIFGADAYTNMKKKKTNLKYYTILSGSTTVPHELCHLYNILSVFAECAWAIAAGDNLRFA